MRNSHLPFTVSARRLAALHATLAEWTRALAPYGDDIQDGDDGTLSELFGLIDQTTSTITSAYIRLLPLKSARRSAAIHVTYNGEVTIADVARVAGCPHRTAQTYLAAFVAEGWVCRVKPGVYTLKIP